jgi:Autotransporter beta-domain
MKRLVCLTMLCTAVLAPRTAVSQEEDAPQQTTSLSIRPLGDNTIGVWHWFAPNLEIGLEAGAMKSHTDAEDEGRPRDSRSFITVEPTAKLYGSPRGALRPYGEGSVYFTSSKYEFSTVDETSNSLGVSLGAGLEWSPVARVRVGGHAGVRAAIIDGETTSYTTGTPVQVDLEGWEASTFTTGLTIYYSF